MTSRSAKAQPLNEGLYLAGDAQKKLFSAILEILADTDVFSHSTSPSVFIVYAHDNDKEVTANSWCVRHLITWLGRLRSRTLSDKSPLPLWSTREGGSAAIRNILDNQFCLIPGNSHSNDTNTITSVDKVVICGSKLLKRYWEDSFTSSYTNAIKASYSEGQYRHVLQHKIRGVVESNCHHPAFHHVLTELAFLELRGSYDYDNSHNIIPVALDNDLMTYLPFHNPSDLVLKLKSFEETDLHHLFFLLLRQIYTDVQSLVNRFEDCYNIAVKRLNDEAAATKVITQDKLGAIVYSEIHKAVNDLQRLDGATLRNVIQESQVRRTLSRLHETLQVSLADKRNRLRRKLSTIPYRDRKDRNQERTEGTCEWFTSHQLFRNWRQSKTSSLLWVSADPGCGKSVLAKYLIDHVLPTTSTRTTCYFFFKDDFEDQRNLESAMRCLLHQLFTQRPDLLTPKIIGSFGEDGQAFASFANLWYTLTSVAHSSKNAGEIVCILDALDECEESGRSVLARALNRLYEKEESEFCLKFLLTSRPYRHIQYEFQILKDRRPTIHLDGADEAEVNKISKEINIVIKAKVKETGARLKLTDDEQQLLQRELTNVTHRTYLWIHLVFDDINNSIEITRGRLLATIRKLPRTVEAAYEKILSKSRDAIIAKRLLHIVVAAKRPLSLQEMATSLAIREEHTSYRQLELEPDERFRNTVRELCGLFVTIVESRIYLLHQTAREFLIYNPTSVIPHSMKWQNSLYAAESHSILAEICVHHLCFPDIEISCQDNLTALVEYAANNWAIHFREALDKNTKRVIHQAGRLCDSHSRRYKKWTAVCRSTAAYDFSSFSTLMIASYFGLEKMVCMQLERNKSELDFNKQDKVLHRSALSLACQNGHEIIVKRLLSCVLNPKGLLRSIVKSSLDINLADKRGQTPLSLAAESGHQGIVRQLLKKGADIEGWQYYGMSAKISVGKYVGMTPLTYAASEGHEGVVRLLLGKGAKTEVRDWYKRTPLLRAVEGGHEGVVRLLLKRRPKLEVGDKTGRTPLLIAAEKGHENIMQRLLKKGAGLEAHNTVGHTPLHIAAKKGRERIVQRLLEKGANIEVQDNHSLTPLAIAAKGGNERIVEQLLEKGANAEPADTDHGRTPLWWAANAGYEGIVQRLLEKGANVDAKNSRSLRDGGGQTALIRAARWGNEGIVQQLLEKGAKIEVQDNKSRTALSWAIREGYEGVVEQLLEKGAKIKEQDRAALSEVGKWNNERIVQHLLEKGG